MSPDLNFTIEGVEVVPFSASPQIAFKLRVTTSSSQPIHTVTLRSQIQIEPGRRSHTAEEKQLFSDLGSTLRPMLWMNTSLVIPGFSNSTVADLVVPCTFDFNVASTKYFAGLTNGDIPLAFYFSGTIFYADDTGALQVAQISWEKEAVYRLPVHVWREMMDRYYPNTTWLCLRRDVFDRLYAYKTQHGIPTFDETLEAIIR